MKIRMLMIGMFCSAIAMAQPAGPVPLEVSANKTVHLLFPSPIVSTDRGSEHVLVQKATAQILKVKADSAFSDTTSLTIITSDGKLYSFTVSYTVSPRALTMDFGAGQPILRDTLLTRLALRARASEQKLHGIRYVSGKVYLQLQGVYSNGQVLALKLRIDNRSAVAYEIGGLNAVVSGGRSGPRRAVQERDIPILLTDSEVVLVREKQHRQLVVILPKAGLAQGQTLLIHVQERGSDRQLHLRVPNNYLLNAILIH